jgi:tRNA(fMet)-specific endonuclease VapC
LEVLGRFPEQPIAAERGARRAALMYFLDTKICIYLIKKKPERVLQKLEKKHPEQVCISSITLGELDYGVKKITQ